MPLSMPVPIELSEDERAQLEGWARRHTSAQALALRSRVVLLAAEGFNNTEIAQRLGVHRPMVRKWRGRFEEHRLDGLTDEPRPGRPRTISDEKVEEVIVKDAGDDAEDRDALVHAVDGSGGGAHADGGLQDLAGVWSAAASAGELEAV